MTSTPALSAAREFSANEYLVVAGYGISYCFGLLSVVLFVQIIRNLNNQQFPTETEKTHLNVNKQAWQLSVLPFVFGTIIVGYFLKELIPIGITGGILMTSLIAGIFVSKKGCQLSDYENIRELGLILFFAGTGIQSGFELINYFSFKYMIYGLVISLASVVLGMICIRKLFSFNLPDTLSIIAGGMTSTPAIGVLKKSQGRIDLSIYAISYVGALITLLVTIRIINSVV